MQFRLGNSYQLVEHINSGVYFSVFEGDLIDGY